MDYKSGLRIFPLRHDDFVHSYVSLPEGNRSKSIIIHWRSQERCCGGVVTSHGTWAAEGPQNVRLQFIEEETYSYMFKYIYSMICCSIMLPYVHIHAHIMYIYIYM